MSHCFELKKYDLRRYFPLKFLLPKIELKCKKCADMFFDHQTKQNDNTCETNNCKISNKVEVNMSNLFKREVSSKEIVEEYLNRDDSLKLINISMFISFFSVIPIWLLELPFIFYTFTLASIITSFILFIKIVSFTDIEKIFHILFPECNESNQYIFEIIFSIADTLEIKDEDYVGFVNSKFDEVKNHYEIYEDPEKEMFFVENGRLILI